jgi:hypothetical protein
MYYTQRKIREKDEFKKFTPRIWTEKAILIQNTKKHHSNSFAINSLMFYYLNIGPFPGKPFSSIRMAWWWSLLADDSWFRPF